MSCWQAAASGIGCPRGGWWCLLQRKLGRPTGHSHAPPWDRRRLAGIIKTLGRRPGLLGRERRGGCSRQRSPGAMLGPPAEAEPHRGAGRLGRSSLFVLPGQNRTIPRADDVVGSTSLSLGVFELVIHVPSILLERDAGPIRRQVPINPLRILASDPQRLVARDGRNREICDRAGCHNR